MAVAHSILVTAYHMLKHKRHYMELGGDFFDVINRDKVRDRLLQRLAKLGFEVTLKSKISMETAADNLAQKGHVMAPAVTEKLTAGN